ncbi:acetate--CoA ligase family protein [Nitratireductor sp. ZSWI3]|uniref:acetate--CoA ligase family protein n=1 Tax=Nitratireductor sp. ZSWI3 TaxID=2966359 RepID=UPI0021506246|nr:acetate--CoA ligase family protein [Nitratireductor sp. ZSWI3]MCR4265280.1 acetate--CoA ligase family protein [Nitratireductor sp. ZSWI3]
MTMVEGSMRYDFAALGALLQPRSVAIVGASSDPTRIGGRPIAAMLSAGYRGRILPVNPGREEVQGLPCYASVAELPEVPEAGIVAVAAKHAPGVVEALGERGCRSVTLFSAGFAETGAEGEKAQAELLSIARRHGMRVLGPNTLGVYNVGIGYYGTFSSSLEMAFPLPGNIGIASQSGAYGAHLAAVARSRGLGASVLITTGNEADVTVADAIGWMAGSDAVDVICAYQEGFRDAGRLIAALEAARAAGKPVFMLKSGRSRLGASAAASHTASLTGDDAVAEAVLAEHGVIRVRDTEQMLDFAYAARQRIYPADNSLGVITVSGGAGIVATDEAEIAGLPMPLMPEEAQARLKEILPFGAPANPLDCTAQALNDLSLFEAFTRAALKDGGYRSILCFLTYVAGGATLAPRLLETLRKIRTDYPDRLLSLCIIADPEVTRAYEEAGFLTFTDPSRAVRAIAAMGQVGDRLAARPAARPRLPRVTLPAASPDEHAAKALLADAGIAAAPERIVHSAEEAAAAAQALGFPVVMKIVSPDIVHKSDIGGVRLGLGDAEAVRAAHDGILDAVRTAAPEARIAGVLVARQLTGGVECLMGINRDPVFGPVAVFGLGGIFVEILDDVAIRPCPFDRNAAREMILSIKAAGVLTGARGRAPADLDALASMLSRLSAFAAAAGPRLRAIDLNPVLALPDGACALDAVIEIGPEARA